MRGLHLLEPPVGGGDEARDRLALGGCCARLDLRVQRLGLLELSLLVGRLQGRFREASRLAARASRLPARWPRLLLEGGGELGPHLRDNCGVCRLGLGQGRETCSLGPLGLLGGALLRRGGSLLGGRKSGGGVTGGRVDRRAG